MEINAPREESATTAEVSLPLGIASYHARIGAVRLEVGGKELTFAPEEFVEMKEMLEWWRRVRSPVSFQPSVGSSASAATPGKAWLVFEDGAGSQQAMRPLWIVDADGYTRALDANTATKLADMLTWFKRCVREPREIRP